MTVPRVIVVAGSIALVVLVLLVGVLVVRLVLAPTHAILVASNAHWAACTKDQAGQGYQCAAVATVTNQGGHADRRSITTSLSTYRTARVVTWTSHGLIPER